MGGSLGSRFVSLLSSSSRLSLTLSSLVDLPRVNLLTRHFALDDGSTPATNYTTSLEDSRNCGRQTGCFVKQLRSTRASWWRRGRNDGASSRFRGLGKVGGRNDGASLLVFVPRWDARRVRRRGLAIPRCFCSQLGVLARGWLLARSLRNRARFVPVSCPVSPSLARDRRSRERVLVDGELGT